ncbi:MAG: hypothetical protein LIO93_00385 [Bacteroidales bacterium]|nr:hypothetical protein [Bacteroidales bacterium]
MKIDRIKHQNIDKLKYDECIGRSPNGTVYALSWYLDIVSPGWYLLATPDYEYVMPLPVKRKLGIPYIIQPLVCQQLGIFSSGNIDHKVIEYFLNKISVLYCYLQLNAGNNMGSPAFTYRPNYVLDLRETYDIIRSGYNKNTKTQLKKSFMAGLSIEKEIDINFALQFVKENSPYYTDKAYRYSCKILEEAARRKILHLWGVRELQTNQVVSIASFIFWKKCFYYLLPVSSGRGKDLQAMRFLIDRFVSGYAGSGNCIDFEGSAISSVAQFYKSFGSALRPYPVFEKNHLSFLTKLIKK